MPDWVEVELDDDSGRPPRRGRRESRAATAPSRTDAPLTPPAAHPDAPPLPPRTETGRGGPSQRTLLALVGAAGLLVGAGLTWALTSGGGGGSAVDPSPSVSASVTTTAPASTPTTTAAGRPLPEVRRTTTTTSVAPVAVTELGAPVLPTSTGLTLVGLSPAGDVVRLVLDTGEVMETTVPGLSGNGGFVVPGSARTLVGTWDSASAYLVDDDTGDASRAPAIVTYNGQALPGDRPDTAWIVTFPAEETAPGSPAVQLVSFDGATLTSPIDVGGGWPNASDLRGGVLVEAPGGTYSVGAAGARLLTPGRVLAIGVNHLVVKECDPTLECAYWLVERDTGVRSPIPSSLAVSDGSFVSGTTSIAPDGRGMVLYGLRGSVFGLRYVDLATGATVELGGGGGPSSTAWTPDGTYVLTLDGLRLRAADRSSVTEVELDERLPLFSMFVAVPSS